MQITILYRKVRHGFLPGSIHFEDVTFLQCICLVSQLALFKLSSNHSSRLEFQKWTFKQFLPNLVIKLLIADGCCFFFPTWQSLKESS